MTLRRPIIVQQGRKTALPGQSRGRPQLSREDLGNEERIVTAFNETRRDLHELTAAASTGELSAQYFYLDVPGSGEVAIVHNIGRAPFWCVVDWRPTAAGIRHNLERASSDENTLTLRSYVAGEATIRVW